MMVLGTEPESFGSFGTVASALNYLGSNFLKKRFITQNGKPVPQVILPFGCIEEGTD